MNELQVFLDEQEQVNESFVVNDDLKANWVLRKISSYERSIKENNAIADAENDKIEQWLQSVNGNASASIDYFQGLLAEYALKKREEDPSFKSIKLPNGNFGFRKRQPKWNYDDEKVLKALKRNDMTDLINLKESPKKVDIKKAFEIAGNKVVNPNTGEVIEGITIEDQEDNFNVKVIE